MIIINNRFVKDEIAKNQELLVYVRDYIMSRNKSYVFEKIITDIIEQCDHEVKPIKKPKSWEGGWCYKCGLSMGWYCPKSKNHICKYEKDEWCTHCGHPEERK